MRISVGDYILTNGDIASMLIVDSLIRLLPGVINKESKKRYILLWKDKVSSIYKTI